ncbi:hypothetical protein HPB51_019789 [Rhipicephalus microplus]|uniref:CCHC-type domain-containing protein n=1 Tax=Rhipicephalus microplus TaxID=6941 RepID=A0A9J6E3U9_RHIMP|nr:hypothetical protein HPB51_019789 [Rhipicephalus microplus]
MAQPTGCESTELHAEEETTPREGATPRRASSRHSETTIVESVFTTLDHSRMANVTKKQLVDELRARGLRCSGRKDELIARIIRDNITRQALEPTDSSTKDQAAYDDDRQAHLETLSANNARLCAELSSLRAQLNRATASERETLHEAHQNASLPTERVATPTLGLHHSVPADITMSSRSTRPPSLNNGTNQDAARPAAPTVSTHEGEPSMAQILAALVNTQALLANTLSRGPPTTSPIQIHSTSDTAALLDARRRTTLCAENDKKPSSSTVSRGQGSNQRVLASSSANLPKANPRSDFSGSPHPRPISARSCFNCGDIGHLSRDCRKPKTPATIRADEKRAKRDNSSHETGCYASESSSNARASEKGNLGQGQPAVRLARSTRRREHARRLSGPRALSQLRT